MSAVLWWCLQNMTMTAVMIAIVMLFSLAFQNRPAVQHVLWVVVLLKFVTPSIVAWPWQLPNVYGGAASPVSHFFNAEPPIDSLPANDSTPGRTEAREDLANPEQSRMFQDFPSGMSNIGAVQVMAGALMSVWLTGTLVFGWRQYRLLKKQALLVRRGTIAPPTLSNAVQEVALQLGMRPVPLLIVRGISSPFVSCLGRLTLAWPEHLLHFDSIASSHSILAHELAHIHRRDHWIAWIELVATAIWWWNPLFSYVRKNLRSSAEMACDAVALDLYPDHRCLYAELLLELSAVSENGASALVLEVSAGTPSSLERRMSMIVSELVSGRLSVGGMLLAALLALVSVPTWSLGDSNDGKEATARPADGPEQISPSAAGSDTKVADSRNFAVYPIKTSLQRKYMGWSKEDQANARAYVAINGMAVVNDAGAIDESALDLDALRKALAPYVNRQNGVVFLNVAYKHFPARNHNAEQLVVWGLEGFGRDCGFKLARGSVTYFNDRSFDWTKQITSVNQKTGGTADDDEEAIGDALVNVYAVRTAFSSFLTGADCIVDVLALPNEDGPSVLSKAAQQSITKYVGEANVRDKNKIVFSVRFSNLKEAQRDRLFGETDALAKSLGFSASSVATR